MPPLSFDRRRLLRLRGPPLSAEARVLLGAGTASLAYAALLGSGAIPLSVLPAVGAFGVLALSLFALSIDDPSGRTAPAPTRAGSAGSPGEPRRRHPPAARQPRSPPSDRGLPRPNPRPMAIASSPRSIPAGDMLWTRLTPETGGRLPVDLVGPMAESFGAMAPEMGLDGPAWTIGATDGATLPTWPAPAAPASTASISRAAWTPTEHEALDHIPPHLRDVPSEWKEICGPHVPARPAPAPAGPHCATCQRALANPPAWRSCSSCHRPFCGECAFRARRNSGTGRCGDCRDRVEVEEPRFVA